MSIWQVQLFFQIYDHLYPLFADMYVLELPRRFKPSQIVYILQPYLLFHIYHHLSVLCKEIFMFTKA